MTKALIKFSNQPAPQAATLIATRPSSSALAAATALALSLAFAVIASGAQAKDGLDVDEFTPLSADSCLTAAMTNNTPIVACVQEANAPCAQTEPGGEAALLCYTTAQEVWGERITTRMDAVTAVASEQLKALAGIELRYDLQMNLLQCERVEAVQLVTRERDLVLQGERARCDALATGLSYAKFFAQSAGVLAQSEGSTTAPQSPEATSPE
jgi:hypothetical protein